MRTPKNEKTHGRPEKCHRVIYTIIFRLLTVFYSRIIQMLKYLIIHTSNAISLVAIDQLLKDGHAW